MKINKKTNIPLVVESVPAVTAIFFFSTKCPDIARVPIIGTNLAKSITIAKETLKKTVFALNPAKAEPLFPPHD